MASRIVSRLKPEDHQLLPRDLQADQGEENCGERAGRRFLKRKLSLRDSYKRKLLALPPEKRQKSVTRTPLRKASKTLKAEQSKYRKLRAHFLAQPENTWCEICERRRSAGENITRWQSVEIHHTRGRIGRLLCWIPGWKPSCNSCRNWPHDHPAQARALGLLSPAHLWNVYPSDY